MLEAGGVHLALDRVGERLGVDAMPAGSGGEWPKPGRSGASTSKLRSSRGSIGFQPRQVWPMPWTRTSGSPEPPRC